MSDIRQLAELCESMDTEAFLPLASEELTSPLGRRVIQFGELVNDLTDRLVAEGLANVRGLRATGGNGYYGRYLSLKGNGAFLHFNAMLWAKHGHSPIWLRITGPDWKPSTAIRDALTGAEPVVLEATDCTLVPIEIASGAERDEVLNRAFRQIERIAGLLPAGQEEETGLPPQLLDEEPEEG